MINPNPPHSPREQKWILLPPHVTPPGVHPSADGLDLATPVTLAEWFEAFYTEAAKGPVRQYGGLVGWGWGWLGGSFEYIIASLHTGRRHKTQQGFREHIVEGVCRQGEVVFVPRGEPVAYWFGRGGGVWKWK